MAQDDGELIQGEFQGKKWQGYTDNFQTWKSFRIPFKANSEPEYTDTELRFDLSEHAEGIGMTGWDWVNRQSKWVAFDFDAIVGHSSRHSQKLTVDELAEIQNVTCDIEWVTTRLSTSGNGLHMYVFLPEGVHTDNHTEHGALARAILHLMSAKTGYDFESKVDICGGNMWVWHRKMRGTNGLRLIKQGEVLQQVPDNWKQHLKVVTGKRRCVLPDFISDDEETKFSEITGQRAKVKLDEKHKELITFLEKSGASFWWDNDNHMLVCHTYDLALAHQHLNLKGVFQTISQGTQRGSDHNCFMFPLRRGAWVVRRYSPGVTEAPTWDQDNNGYTRCYYNQDPDLRIMAICHGGIEHQTGGYVFSDAESAIKAAKGLDINIELPAHMLKRQTKVKHNKDGKLVVEIAKESNDDKNDMPGWLANERSKHWAKVYNIKRTLSVEEPDTYNFDDLIRHITTEDGTSYGWMVRSEDQWTEEPLAHVLAALKSMGLKDTEAKSVVGTNIFKPWKLTNLPFQPEYPGDRQWNRNAAQFAFAPDLKKEEPEYPHWKMILDHIGKGLDAAVQSDNWCKYNGINSGADYLKCWIASLFQCPFEPLPYLFLYSEEQSTGKSILHEALGLLMTHGYHRADHALRSSFNGELEKAVLCVVEEVDLQADKRAYNAIKDFVTALQISIHRKGKTPFMVPNTTHWIQCANDITACPMFEGDTRITVINVPVLKKTIAKRLLIQSLKKEAPDFLASVLKLELPEYNDRLRIPVIETSNKVSAVNKNQTLLQQFISEECHYKLGHKISVADFFIKFQNWLDPMERHQWTKNKISKHMPERFIRGRDRSNAQWCYGNISFDANAVDGKPYILYEGKLAQ